MYIGTQKTILLYSIINIGICIIITSTAVEGTLWKDMDIFCNLEDYSVKIDREGCDRQYFPVKACLGNCRSFEKPLQDNPFFMSACQLCQTTKINKYQFSLNRCDEGVDRTVIIESAVECACITSTCV